MARYDNVGRDARGLALCPVWFFGHICLFGASCIHPRLPPDGCEKVGKLVCVCSPQYENARKKKVPGLMCISGLRLLIFDTRGGGCRVCACVCVFSKGEKASRLPRRRKRGRKKKKRVFETEATPIGNFKNAIQPVRMNLGCSACPAFTA